MVYIAWSALSGYNVVLNFVFLKLMRLIIVLIPQSELIPIPSKFIDAPYSADKASILRSSLS